MLHFKNLVLLLLLAGAPFSLAAQDCFGYVLSEEGARATYAMQDHKGKPNGEMTWTVEDITATDEGWLITLGMSFKDKKGETLDAPVASQRILCTGSDVRMDIDVGALAEAFADNPEVEITMEGDKMVLPNELKENMTLPDAQMTTIVKMSGMTLVNATVRLTDRTVLGKEQVTTPAGTFDCFKITQTTETKAGLAGTRRTATVSWVAKGIGMVKSEDYDHRGRLTSKSELIELVR
ncbi:MAG: hypothetical protein D6818_03280 [Bacteroidetes bacterium]|nr:MAG: hypothetical protein D6818_03280 [Bacteroidota bacterium]